MGMDEGSSKADVRRELKRLDLSTPSRTAGPEVSRTGASRVLRRARRAQTSHSGHSTLLGVRVLERSKPHGSTRLQGGVLSHRRSRLSCRGYFLGRSDAERESARFAPRNHQSLIVVRFYVLFFLSFSDYE
jgi:hypothetical protein